MIDELRDFLTKTRAGIARKTRHVMLLLTVQILTMTGLLSLEVFREIAGHASTWLDIAAGMLTGAAALTLFLTVPRVRAGRALLRQADECLAAVEDLPPLLNAFTMAEWVQHTKMHDDFQPEPTEQNG